MVGTDGFRAGPCSMRSFSQTPTFEQGSSVAMVRTFSALSHHVCSSTGVANSADGCHAYAQRGGDRCPGLRIVSVHQGHDHELDLELDDERTKRTAVRHGCWAGTGVGKGRQIAGLVFENYLRGRRKHVWVSVSGDLVDDARRDMRDIGKPSFRVCRGLRVSFQA
jgi:hypothetical protein